MSEYNTECPRPECEHGSIKLVSFHGSCNIPVSDDGWALTDGPCDTSEEKFMCSACRMTVPALYVFKQMSKKAAAKTMNATDE